MSRILAFIFLFFLMGSILGIAIIGVKMEWPVKTIESEEVKDLHRIIQEKDRIIKRQKQIIAQLQQK